MSFDLFPAVDLRGGRCVQLVGGIPGTEVVSLDDPLAQAVRWAEMGSSTLHIIDLDGAIQGVRINGPILQRIVESLDLFVQVGGGVRSREDAELILDLGVDRVILGTAALARPEMVKNLAADYGSDRVMVALDVRGGKVTTEGWQRDLEKGAIELGLQFQERGAGSILFTNIDTEGRLRGIDPEPTRRLIEAVEIPVVAAGGVSTVEDILVLRDVGAAGAVVGTAIYTGKLDFKKALSALRS
ncbi:MAG: 1-(5-phosphoribosyl)-5-[(5-phosphoribosylamino)methylideneamino]imidazole-4-carboxamide isomerase [Methanothrix sp.]|jgi:phosphoribosylformimino-5-aminoimidazole carboxamide ribotide isomerase|uniref:1-(5-phosphoribosyl)-5-[(5-phosphoribosylamino)methylideneamino] imidazole-4-carboxamide isomerase n=1 Tax=Methanothrix harundinacea TaxID=301375 RepID=A0A124FMN4_9EURY|nr:MAG: 1-(5-phosphoribosyl)-5-[(5-phosphoribosylamino)methylideneamino] imidazole-4-carboxamide isomerase [Methanosaeta sp. SDB]KUK45313.1 MAG: 1-(5-phosphoribosyl)-5-[(5-phosphoribosylamino)methylideneamino] imidazole-4-carboxamide isomerase [Methanothrix harundinacea]MDD2637718.1 1-(5-phosphoribosyl)-5-[(5-phosphoribosylamino)methylideneamino]imidazole-4-carboxamide isomerase [Methanothrix sp.]MDI9399599.1 1-(5-phosphoribosyl)-5-[(5-phosphoribosylamino)methylideneamino]imidazole-4-carboxamide